MAPVARQLALARAFLMWLLLLEALAALLIFVFIIWWTMFSGRQRGERQADADGEVEVPADAGPLAARTDRPVLPPK